MAGREHLFLDAMLSVMGATLPLLVQRHGGGGEKWREGAAERGVAVVTLIYTQPEALFHRTPGTGTHCPVLTPRPRRYPGTV
eukprot:2619531-Rhodomonas_salina.8